MKRVAAIAGVVLVNALVQALCVLPGATPAVGGGFLGLLAVSTVVLIAAATATLVLVGAPGVRRPRVVRALAAVIVALVVVAALTVLSPLAGAVGLLVAIVVASPAGNADAGALDGPRSFRQHPFRAVLLLVATVLAIAVAMVAALVFGLFVTGAFGAFSTWVVGGVVLAMIARGWARLAVRANGSSGRRAGPAPDRVQKMRLR